MSEQGLLVGGQPRSTSLPLAFDARVGNSPAVSEAKAKARVGWIDIAKGIGIFLVVAGHTLGGLINSGILAPFGLSDFFIRAIYSFHMPLFFFLSGLFIEHSTRRDLSSFLGVKARTIIYPYLVWSLISGVMQHSLSGSVNNQMPWRRLITIIYSPIDQYWFLYALFVMTCLYWVARRVRLTAINFSVIAGLLYIASVLKPEFFPSGTIDLVARNMIYFAFGGVLGQRFLDGQSRERSSPILVAIAGCGYFLVAMAALINQSWDDLLAPAVASIGIAATLALSLAISRWKIGEAIRLCGIYSLEIYVLHTIFSAGLRIVLLNRFGVDNAAIHIVGGILIGMLAPLIIANISYRLRFPYLFTFGPARA